MYCTGRKTVDKNKCVNFTQKYLCNLNIIPNFASELHYIAYVIPI